jgi:hypothetical protein
MKRSLLNLLTALSLLLCVTTALLWVRSYRAVDVVQFSAHRFQRAVSGGGTVGLLSAGLFRRTGDFRSGGYKGGQLVVYTERQLDYATGWLGNDGNPPPRWRRVRSPYASPTRIQTQTWVPPSRVLPRVVPAGVKARTKFNNVTDRCDEDWLRGNVLWVPYWLPAVAFAAAPAWWLWRPLLRRRKRLGLCPQCGYDLRATPDKCPECGTPAATPV